MTHREYIHAQLETLPDSVMEKIAEYISFQRYSLGMFENDTDYLMSVPGMAERIREGINTPLSECVPLSEVWTDV